MYKKVLGENSFDSCEILCHRCFDYAIIVIYLYRLLRGGDSML